MTADAEALLRAASEGKVDEVRALLASGVPVDPVPAGADSPLCLAAMYGQRPVAEVLVAAGADVRRRGGYGCTPLHYAARKDLALTSLLLERGADPNARNDGDEDPLEYLVTNDGADGAIVQRLIDGGLDLSARPQRYYVGRSHLMWACFCSRLGVVRVLLAAGVDPNETAKDGSTALGSLMSREKKPDDAAILRALVEAGLSTTARRPYYDETALMVACRWGDVASVKSLLERGADPNARSNTGTTPLTCADESGNDEVREVLLKRGAVPARHGPEVTDGVRAAEAAARAAPENAEVRLAYAAALLDAGFRAAAASEVAAAEALGAGARAAADGAPSDAPAGAGAGGAAVAARLSVTTADGVTWQLSAKAPAGVTSPVMDERVPGAVVRSGDRVLPLVVVLGTPCTRCDEKGETVCPTCNGTGWRPSMFGDDDVSCIERDRCTDCGGTKYVVNTSRGARGRCKHASLGVELESLGSVFKRCPACGLAAMSTGGHWSDMTACGACARFDCSCGSGGGA